MKCPRCNEPLQRIDRNIPDSQETRKVFYCDHCGWGKQQLENDDAFRSSVPPGPPPRSVSSAWLIIIGLWGLSAAFVIVPYLLLVNIPFLFGGVDVGMFDAEAASRRMTAALNPLYWIIAGTYVLICATFDPLEIDWNDMGWFGGLMNNPFSYTDNMNRKRFVLLLMMIPGKIIVATLTATYRHISNIAG